jgi:hypothetical protein
MILWLCIFILSLLAGMTALNALTLVRLDSQVRHKQTRQLSISVLIPARNEAANLQKLLPALLKSTLEPHEILVLDDGSEDQTFEVATSLLAASSFHFKVIKGAPWSPHLQITGKNHACAQLAKAATGDIFLFCDADVIPSKYAIERTLNILNHYRCAGLSALPVQHTLGRAEQLTLPWILQLPLLTLLPLGYAWRLGLPSMQMANGQWLAVRKERYHAVGGHQALGLHTVEDVELSRRLADPTQGGLIPVLSTTDLAVQMYRDWPQMVQGFAKNIIQIYGGGPIRFLAGLVIWFFLFSSPLWGLFINPTGALVAALLILFIRLCAANIFRMPRLDLIYHLQSLYYLAFLGLAAVRLRRLNEINWKGRHVEL